MKKPRARLKFRNPLAKAVRTAAQFRPKIVPDKRRIAKMRESRNDREQNSNTESD